MNFNKKKAIAQKNTLFFLKEKINLERGDEEARWGPLGTTRGPAPRGEFPQEPTFHSEPTHFWKEKFYLTSTHKIPKTSELNS